MPAALLANAVDAYATGEPFGAKAEMDGYARVLYMTRDVWPTYICCVLAVRQELIDQRSEEHTSELQSQSNLVCRLLLEKKKNKKITTNIIARLYLYCTQCNDYI